MVIIVSGNFVDGFQFHGPFPDRDAAATWDNAMNEGRGQVYTLRSRGDRRFNCPTTTTRSSTACGSRSGNGLVESPASARKARRRRSTMSITRTLSPRPSSRSEAVR